MRYAYTTMILCLLGAPLNGITAEEKTTDAWADRQADFHSIVLHVENDVFITDQYFTNGIRFEYLLNYKRHGKEELPDDLWEPMPTIFKAMEPGDDWDRFFRGYTFGQNMYTPTDITRADITYGDHPYAAWLYAGGFWGIESRRSSQRMEVSLGVVGPLAQGKFAQTRWHQDVTDSPDPEGWNNQIPNKPAFQTTYDFRATAFDSKYFLLANSLKAELGNVFTRAGAGVVFKLGLKNNSRPDSLGQPIPTNIPSFRADSETNDDPRGKGRQTPNALEEAELYVFAEPMITGVLYNGMLEGGLFDGSRDPARAGGDVEFYGIGALAAQMNPDASPLDVLGAYRYLVREPFALNRYSKYIVYANTFRSGYRLGTDYLIFNTLFDGGKRLSADERFMIANSVLFENGPADPLEILFAYTLLQRDRREPLRPEEKLFAYYMLNRRKPVRDPLQFAAVYYALLRRGDVNATYTVRKRPYFGSLRVGLVHNNRWFALSLTAVWRSVEFRQAEGLRDYHQYWEARLTVHCGWDDE